MAENVVPTNYMYTLQEKITSQWIGGHFGITMTMQETTRKETIVAKLEWQRQFTQQTRGSQ